jgi:hypothetical protein
MFRHYYAHHQELKNYKDGCGMWYITLWFTGRWSGAGLYVMRLGCGMLLDAIICMILELLMMGMIVPETC